MAPVAGLGADRSSRWRAATDVVAPARPVALGEAPQMLLSLWVVEDVDAACQELA